MLDVKSEVELWHSGSLCISRATALLLYVLVIIVVVELQSEACENGALSYLVIDITFPGCANKSHPSELYFVAVCSAKRNQTFANMMNAPKYDLLPSNDHTIVDRDDTDDSSRPSIRNKRHLSGARKFWIRTIRTGLLIYCAAVTTIVLALMVTILSHLRSQTICRSRQATNLFKAVYGHDLEYMSVNHKYDPLWEVQDGTASVVYLPDEEFGGDVSPAVLSM